MGGMSIKNKTIWTLWHQGFETAPETVKLCLESWRRLNPDWEIIALDRRSLADFVDLRAVVDPGRRDLTLQKIAAIARLCLLRDHGGVWADATVYCRKPLDLWLADHCSRGFFAFRDPGPDRLMSNWFIAADADNHLLGELHRNYLAVWKNNYYWNQNNSFGRFAVKSFSPLFNRNIRSTRFWFSLPVRKFFGVYPYFQFHYMFNRLIQKDRACRMIWDEGRALGAREPHRLQELQHEAGGARAAIGEIDAAASPVYKLDWRIDPNCRYWAAVLRRLHACLPAKPGDALKTACRRRPPAESLQQ
jgi:hypothetical protein